MNQKFILTIDKIEKFFIKRKKDKLMKDVKINENEIFESYDFSQSSCSFNEND